MCSLCLIIKVKSTLLNSGLRKSLYTLDKEQKVTSIFWQYLEYKPGLTHQHLGQQKLQQQWNFTKLGIAITDNKKNPTSESPKPPGIYPIYKVLHQSSNFQVVKMHTKFSIQKQDGFSNSKKISLKLNNNQAFYSQNHLQLAKSLASCFKSRPIFF